MSSMLKSLAALFALVGAFYLSISYEYGDPGWRLEFSTQSANAKGDAEPAEYDLKSLQVLNRSVIQIKENYVDPSRISERKMIGGAMEEVQRAVPELLAEIVRDSEGVPERVTIRVDQAEQTFDLRDVENLWQMSFKFKDIFGFIQRNLKHFKQFRDVEYAAINGMLSTLDPHSVLLRPQDYREMKLSTRGKFGGLGIVISIREGQLTIINPIEDTPASRAGLKANDRIVQINLDSTINMPLSSAVEMLRGPPNTKVDVWVMREGWKKQRKFTLTRADIKIKSVAFKLLPGKVGLVRIRNFQNTTSDELHAALKKLRKRGNGLRGLIVDLRSNPGGLLDQAIKVADLFVESGTLVTTVGFGDKMREPKMATRGGTEEPYPLVVLTNQASASASEIVAGALKNHNRAVLIGQQTFGKGSVQVIYDNKDDSALKLTIAQYLTPGDISIQSVGIMPDILTKAVVLTDEDTDFFRGEAVKHGENELPEHLEHKSSQISKAQKPRFRVKYLQDPKLEKKIEENPNDLIIDFNTSLARDLIAASTGGTRDEVLEESKEILAARMDQEVARIAAALQKRGVDWTPLDVPVGQPKAEITVKSSQPGDVVKAGDKIDIEVTVRNVGDAPFVQLRALSDSENELFKSHEFLFGTIAPGEARTWKVPVKVPRSALTRRDAVKLEFKELHQNTPEAASLKVAVEQLARPRFAITWRIDDTKAGNGDGLLQLGEEVDLILDVTNVGQGRSFTTLATLRNAQDDDERGIFIKRGRVSTDNMNPGQTTQARFSFRVKKELDERKVPVTLTVMDTDLRELTSEKTTLQVSAGADALQKRAIRLAPRHGAEIRLRGSNTGDAPAIAVVTGAVAADARVGGWYRVPAGGGLFNWASASEVDERAGDSAAGALRPVVPKGPPVITLNGSQADVETKNDALTLSGEALSERIIKDLLIFVNNKKVFFKSNSGATNGNQARLRFSARVPLEKGVNRITVIAREDEELSGRRTVIVNRAVQ